MLSSSSPSISLRTRRTSRRRASAPSRPSTTTATASQANASRKAWRWTATRARKAQTAPLAVNRWVAHAPARRTSGVDGSPSGLVSIGRDSTGRGRQPSQYTEPMFAKGGRQRGRSRLCALLLSLVVVGTPGSPARDLSDDEFIDALGDTTSTQPVDRRRLAKILFSFAATLEGGKSTVQLLQSKAVVPEPSRQDVRSLLEARFADYERALAGFKGSVSELLDQPESLLVLHRSLQAGQRTC